MRGKHFSIDTFKALSLADAGLSVAEMVERGLEPPGGGAYERVIVLREHGLLESINGRSKPRFYRATALGRIALSAWSAPCRLAAIEFGQFDADMHDFVLRVFAAVGGPTEVKTVAYALLIDLRVASKAVNSAEDEGLVKCIARRRNYGVKRSFDASVWDLTNPGLERLHAIRDAEWAGADYWRKRGAA